METYIAKVIPLEKGWYEIEFPDLPGTHAAAKGLGEVMREAQESLASFLDISREQNLPIASPSPLEALSFEENEAAVIVTVDLEAYRRERNERAVKKTVSLPLWLAESAERMGLSLSKLLQDAIRQRIAH